MNSYTNPRKSNPSQVSGSLSSNYQFDFGSFSSSRPSSLNDHKTSSASSSSWAPSKPPPPSWTHQPSMAGDIFGKTWASSAPSTSATRIGIVEKNPDLFGDLVGAVLGQGKNSSSIGIGRNSVPLKNMAAAPPQKNSYSMGSLADSIPKTGDSVKKSGWESEGFGGFSAGNGGGDGNRIGGFSAIKVGPSANSKSDPFETLVDFGLKKPPLGNSSSDKNSSSSDYSFGEFQNPPTASSSAFGSKLDDFGTLAQDFGSKLDDFGTLAQDFATQMPPPPPTQSSAADPFDMLFSSSSTAASVSASASIDAFVNGGLESKLFSEVDDWVLDSEFGGSETGNGGTIELEGLPPPPVGVTTTMAKEKGLDHHKQGQYPDAIKWLSWAVALLEKAGDDATAAEILSCRAECYKEVGEYKKAVTDCSMVLEQDSTNVSVLLQRALLYESSEKYKLGADDLRAVLKIDPGNRLAKSTIHRLAKLAD